MVKEQHYNLSVVWTGNLGQATRDYQSYDRSYVISAPGKTEIRGSSDPLYRGDAHLYNPEELLIASISSCHMLWFLHLCSDKGILIEDYRDRPTGTMGIHDTGRVKFQKVTLYPTITLRLGSPFNDAIEDLHELAHQQCFIANSVNFPISISSTWVYK